MGRADTRLSLAAARDLEAIWTYGADRWGRDQANAYARRLREVFGLLASMPGMGRPLAPSRGRLRGYSAEKHIIVYRAEGDGILILRVLGPRQDWLALMGEG
jgi:toxin ParE1/3/4